MCKYLRVFTNNIVLGEQKEKVVYDHFSECVWVKEYKFGSRGGLWEDYSFFVLRRW